MENVETITCIPYGATFSKRFCAESHIKANAKETKLWRPHCKKCPTGAACLGSNEYLDRSILFGSKRCARCERLSDRLICGLVCVSCKNREYESHTGLNGRGNPLQIIRQYYLTEVTFALRNGEIKSITIPRVLGRDEAKRSIQLTQPDLDEIKLITLTPIPPTIVIQKPKPKKPRKRKATNQNTQPKRRRRKPKTAAVNSA